MIKNIDVRFFIYTADYENQIEAVVYETTERCFLSYRDEGSTMSYVRHGVFNNGVDQICLTLEPNDIPHFNEIERITEGKS